MTDTDAEVKTLSAQSKEVGEATTSPHPRREGEVRETNGGNGDVDQRTTGTTKSRTNSNYSGSLTGGIIDQLIEDYKDRLEKARASVKWYQDEEQEILKRLEGFYHLKELTLQQTEIEESESE